MHFCFITCSTKANNRINTGLSTAVPASNERMYETINLKPYHLPLAIGCSGCTTGKAGKNHL